MVKGKVLIYDALTDSYKMATPYVYFNNGWRTTIAKVYDGTNWRTTTEAGVPILALYDSDSIPVQDTNENYILLKGEIPTQSS